MDFMKDIRLERMLYKFSVRTIDNFKVIHGKLPENCDETNNMRICPSNVSYLPISQ